MKIHDTLAARTRGGGRRTTGQGIVVVVSHAGLTCVSYARREIAASHVTLLHLQFESLSGPMFFGGLGRLRMTSFASCDLFTMTSFSLTAVCMRRTLEESFLLKMQ